jgi:hypothetical protein
MTDLVLYLLATAAIWNLQFLIKETVKSKFRMNVTLWYIWKEIFLWRIYSKICYCTYEVRNQFKQ